MGRRRDWERKGEKERKGKDRRNGKGKDAMRNLTSSSEMSVGVMRAISSFSLNFSLDLI